MTTPEAQPDAPTPRRFQYSLRALFGLTVGVAAFFSVATTFGYDDALLALVEVLILVGVVIFCRNSAKIAGSVWRPVVYGASAGVVCSSLVMLAGWTSPEPESCFLQCFTIMCGGIGCGFAVDLAVALRAQPRDPSSRKRPTAGWVLGGMLAGIPVYWVLVPWYTCDPVGYTLQTAEHLIWGSIYGAIAGAVIDIGINLRRGWFRGWRLRFSALRLLVLSIAAAAVYGIARMYLMMESLR
jgi:hypothetical protein